MTGVSVTVQSEPVIGLQIRALATRSVLRMIRSPATLVPTLVFPIFLLAVNVGGLDSATELPGFPTDSYLTFALAFTFIQSAIFSTMNAGQAVSQDIENGFFDRLVLTPMRPSALMVGQLTGLALLGVFQAFLYLTIGLVFGADFAAGPAGVAVLLVLVIIISLGFGGIGLIMALKTGSSEAVQGMFPLMFVLLFFSSMALPRDLIETTWFRTITDLNPVSYLIEALRSLMITGWDPPVLAAGFAIAIVLAFLTISIAAKLLSGRMDR